MHRALSRLSVRRFSTNPIRPAVTPFNDVDVAPKYIYEIKNLPDHYPIMYGGYPPHHHDNPFIEEATSAYEMWNYQYSGHWWDFGPLGFKILAIVAPVLMLLRIIYKSEQRRARGQGAWGDTQMSDGYAWSYNYPIEY